MLKQRFNIKNLHILIFIIIFATKIITNFRIMVGILIFSAIAAFITLGVGHTLNRMGKHVSSYPHKGMEDEPKLTIEDMYSPNNNLSLFFKDGNSYSVLVSNHSIDKEEFVFADNTINLRNKVARVLRNYAALEKSQNKDSVIL